MSKESLAHPVPKVPPASSARLSPPNSAQFVSGPFTGEQRHGPRTSGIEGQGCGTASAPSTEPAQTNRESELDKEPLSVPRLCQSCRGRVAWAHLTWHLHAGWMATGFPKVSHLTESSAFFQSPNSNRLSNPPTSRTRSDTGRTLGFHSLETPESFLPSSTNSQVR